MFETRFGAAVVEQTQNENFKSKNKSKIRMLGKMFWEKTKTDTMIRNSYAFKTLKYIRYRSRNKKSKNGSK